VAAEGGEGVVGAGEFGFATGAFEGQAIATYPDKGEAVL
jgi:hypothetical protein